MGEAPLHLAAKYDFENPYPHGDGQTVGLVPLLLDHGADVNARDEDGNTPLHLTHQTFIAGQLIKNGAEVNAENNMGETPLIRILRDGKPSLGFVCFLKNKGSDVNARDYEGNTALHWAAVRKEEDIGALLVENGADILAKNSKGQTPLDI